MIREKNDVKMGRGIDRIRMGAKALAVALAVCVLCLAGVGLRAQGTGYWHTSGNEILDSTNKVVRIAGINWSGFETTSEVVHGLYAQDYKYILDGIKSNGYNTVRLPYSNQMVETPIVPSEISFSNASGAINADLEGLNSLQILDRIVDYAGEIGLRILLDNHRSEAGETAEANGLWYTDAYPESAWISDWELLAERYAGNSTVIGMDLRDEPHAVGSGGACWTCATEADDWHLAAERAGNAILTVNPKLLIFVEGTDTQPAVPYWWGGNLTGVKKFPVVLNVQHQLVYSAHEYGPVLYKQSWFNAKTTPASLKALWARMWGYVSTDKIAPVWVGEFGTPNDAASLKSSVAGSQGEWFETLVAYMSANKNISWAYWDMAEDQFALLDGNWVTKPVSAEKQTMLDAIEFKLVVATSPTAPATSLTATTISTSEIDLAWTGSTTADVTYNLYATSGASLKPSASTLVASGLTATAYHNTGLKTATTYSYVVEAVSPAGVASAASNEAAAKTAMAVAGCAVGYSIVSDWGTGFEATLLIENTGTTTLNNWTLQWTFAGNQAVTDLWDGNVAQNGANVTVTSENYNGSVAPGASVQGVGFTANYSGTNAAPTAFTVNGVACQ